MGTGITHLCTRGTSPGIRDTQFVGEGKAVLTLRSDGVELIEGLLWGMAVEGAESSAGGRVGRCKGPVEGGDHTPSRAQTRLVWPRQRQSEEDGL